VALRRGALFAVAWSGRFGSRRLPNRANGNLVGIADGPDVICGQGDHRLRVSGCSYELDLDTIWLINFDNGAKIAATQPVLGQVAVEYDSIK
jgi:hypothetical protein